MGSHLGLSPPPGLDSLLCGISTVPLLQGTAQDGAGILLWLSP